MSDQLTDISWTENLGDSEKKKLFVLLHTLKGESRTLGLRLLSTRIHETESMLKEQDVKSRRVEDAVTEIIQLIASYQQTFEQIFDDHASEASATPVLLGVIHDGLWDLNRRLAEHGLVLEDLNIHDDIGSRLGPDAWQRLKSIFLHVLNNVADHGFIFPLQKTGQRRGVRLKIQGLIRDDKAWITVADNGAGLNVEGLREKARKHNLTFDPNAPENVLFFGGVSTAESVSQTSGRGIGMRAVHDLVAELGGQVTFRSNPEGQGSLLTITLPLTEGSHQRQDQAV